MGLSYCRALGGALPKFLPTMSRPCVEQRAGLATFRSSMHLLFTMLAG